MNSPEDKIPDHDGFVDLWSTGSMCAITPMRDNHDTGEIEISILPEHNVILIAYSGNAERFARLFRETWLEIRSDDPGRQQADDILDHWPDDGPFIALEARTPGWKGVIASVGRRGTNIAFDSRFIDRMPDDVVKVLIAHELAHVYQFATGRMDHLNYDEAEDDANNIIEVWGFYSGDLDGWHVAEFFKNG